MKIVVLDGYTENPGDISWAPLEKLGEVTVYDRPHMRSLRLSPRDLVMLISLLSTKLRSAKRPSTNARI